jgi:hypothetical protein
MAADDLAAEQEHRNMQPVAALQLRIRIHVTHIDGRQAHGARERCQLREHVLTELAVAPLHDGEPGTIIRRVRSDGSVSG